MIIQFFFNKVGRGEVRMCNNIGYRLTLQLLLLQTLVLSPKTVFVVPVVGQVENFPRTVTV